MLRWEIADPFPMLMLGVLLSGLSVSEAVALTWEALLIDEGGRLSFAVGGRSIPLSSRIEQDAFQVAVHLGRRRSAERVLGVKRRTLSNRFRASLSGVGGDARSASEGSALARHAGYGGGWM